MNGAPTIKGDIRAHTWLAFPLEIHCLGEVFPAMPTYEYRCPNGHHFEIFQRMSDEPRAECPTCGEASERLLSGGAGFLFKGEGFYATDYRSESYKQEASKEESAKLTPGPESGAGKKEKASSGGSGKSGASSESKPGSGTSGEGS